MDAAFKTRPWPSCTTAQLQAFVDAGHEKADAMLAEIKRRTMVANGNLDVATPGERLRIAQGVR